MSKLKALCKDGLDHLLSKIEEKYVQKETGKGLSTNDFTTAEKQKLAGLESPSIKSIKVNNKALTPDSNKSVNIDLSDYATKSDISNVYKFKGSKTTYAELPTSGNIVGDVYNIETADKTHGISAGDNVAWDGTKWDKLGGTLDTSAFALKTDLDSYVQKETGKGLSTNDYTTAEKEKLAGLKNYTHPTTDGNKHVPANGTNNGGKFLRATSTAGTYEWADIVEAEAITNEEIDTLFS